MLNRIKNLVKNVNNRSLGMVIFFVTSRCNARCAHCFNWMNINKSKEDLTLKEIEQLTKTMPAFEMVLFSGGEPFLRDELGEIIGLFYKNAGIINFSIPTNGSLPEKITKITNEVLIKYPEVKLSVNFSLDGLQPYHDATRGLSGCFSKLEESIDSLRSLRKKYRSRLAIKTNTVIMPKSEKRLKEFISFLEKKFPDLDDHLFELIRGNPRDSHLKQKMTKEELVEIFDNINKHKAKMLLGQKKSMVEIWLKLANLILIQTVQLDGSLGKGWGMSCLAGQTIVVIDHNGCLRHCELRDSVTKLRDNKMNFMKTWNNKESEEERMEINKAKCWNNCTHICFVADSIYKHPKTYFIKVPKAIFKSAQLLLKIKRERKNEKS